VFGRLGLEDETASLAYPDERDMRTVRQEKATGTAPELEVQAHAARRLQGVTGSGSMRQVTSLTGRGESF
jgi:hypothetical protein